MMDDKWIDVMQRLPLDASLVLVRVKGGIIRDRHFATIGCREGAEWRRPDGILFRITFQQVTHWQPLPEV